MSETISVTFETDAEGFLSRACSACDGRFKVVFGKGSAEPVGFCPFCDHLDEQWFTTEQAEYVQALIASTFVQPEIEKISRSLEELSRVGRGLAEVTMTESIDFSVPPKPVERADDLPARTTFVCCGETIRHESSTPPTRCVICGKAV